MTFQQLKYLSAIEKYGSFNEAARQLYISQSSISSAVKELEQELGIAIFNRSSRGAELTPQGLEFMRYCNRMLAVLGEIGDRYQPAEQNGRLMLTISSQHYLFAEDAFVELVSRCGERPYLLSFREGTLASVLEDVATYRSEIGVVFMSKYNMRSLEKTMRDRKLEFHPVIKAQPAIFVRRGHPLALRGSVSLEDLEPYPHVLFEVDYAPENSVLSEILPPQRRERVIRVFERSTLFSIISHTDAYNIGSGLLPEKYLPSYTAVPIAGDSDAFMTVGWVCRRGGELSEPALDYIGLISHFADRYEALHRQP